MHARSPGRARMRTSYSIVVYSPLDCHPDAVERELNKEEEDALECSSEEEDEETKAQNDEHVRKSIVSEKKEETIFSKYDICR